nr:ComEC/Rec2 family competence protein [Clostridium cellulovorans]
MLLSVPPVTAATTSSVSGIKIHYIDVGQGDSILIQTGSNNILIDAGENDNSTYNYLKTQGITKLNYIIVTHPHADHIGNIAKIINSFSVGTFYAPKITASSAVYTNMVTALSNKGLKITVPSVGSKITIGNATLQFLAPNSSKYSDTNNYSIVTKLTYGNKSFIFMGDAETLSEGEILAKQLDVSADVIKIGHHGSTSSTSKSFLKAVNPKYAIISVGEGNSYNHPADETLAKLENYGITVYRTDLNGTIIATCDGFNINFTTPY